MRTLRHIGLAVGITLCCACGESISTPVPQPLPGQPEADLVRISSPDEPADPTLVTGLPGAVQGAGVVQVRDLELGLEVSAATTAEGTFVVVMAVGQAGRFEARFGDSEGRFSSWTPMNPRRRGEPAPSLEPSDGDGPVSAPDAQGRVAVSNLSAEGTRLLEVLPGLDVVVTNLNTGAAAGTTSDPDGVFTATLAAEVGQSIAIFLADSEDATLTSDFLLFEVPRP